MARPAWSRGGAKLASRRSAAALALGLLGCLASAGAFATPFTPEDDNQVLERLPDAQDQSGQASRRALAADPRNLGLAVQVARQEVDLARAQGDPRWLGRAEAALAPWPADAGAPAEVLLLRAVILQSNHDFAASVAALGQVLAADPRNGQAWLTRASVRQVRADYPAALADCGQFANLTLGLAPDTCTASAMSLTGHARLALKAVTISLRENVSEPASTRLWAMTLAAETAARLSDPTAESRFAQALALDGSDPYLLGAWSDWLLDHGRAAEVVGLLRDRTRIDPLLLRLAIAEQALKLPTASDHIDDLAARFDTSRLRADVVHRREEARFRLVLLHDAQGALALARANWEVQREPADARILLEAALAAGRPDAAAPVLGWLRDNAVEDAVLTGLATKLPAAMPR